LAMLVVAGADHRIGWSSVAPAVLAAAYLGVGSGILVVFLVMRENAYASGVVEVATGQPVIDSGPYRVIRHPMYAGYLLVAAATPLALGSYWAELAFVPLAALVTARLLAEERFLAARLPGYAEYMARTAHRLIPGVF
jgi:protein-S-isoprenylcysteine O-methyltransferase Ste14